jgi:hypothetical protein
VGADRGARHPRRVRPRHLLARPGLRAAAPVRPTPLRDSPSSGSARGHCRRESVLAGPAIPNDGKEDGRPIFRASTVPRGHRSSET